MPVAKRMHEAEPKANVSKGKIPPWIGAFLGGLCEGKSPTHAARDAGIPAAMAYTYRRRDPAFLLAWNEAAGIGTDLLEKEAERRAYHGVDEPVFYQGEVCGAVKKYSDGLLQFLLKARRPEVYRDMVEQGKGSAVTVSIQANLAAIAALNKALEQGSALGGGDSATSRDTGPKRPPLGMEPPTEKENTLFNIENCPTEKMDNLFDTENIDPLTADLFDLFDKGLTDDPGRSDGTAATSGIPGTAGNGRHYGPMAGGAPPDGD